MADSFEQTMSILTAGIGKVERLSGLKPDQLSRLREAAIRLSNAQIAKAKEK